MQLHWPLDKVGNAFQLLGVTVAALGVPVVPPFLGRVERLLNQAASAARKRARGSWIAARAWWARRRGKTQDVSLSGIASGQAFASGEMATVHKSVDREIVADRESLNFLQDEIDRLWKMVRRVEKRQADDWREFERRLATQGEELRAPRGDVPAECWRVRIAARVRAPAHPASLADIDAMQEFNGG